MNEQGDEDDIHHELAAEDNESPLIDTANWDGVVRKSQRVSASTDHELVFRRRAYPNTPAKMLAEMLFAADVFTVPELLYSIPLAHQDCALGDGCTHRHRSECHLPCEDYVPDFTFDEPQVWFAEVSEGTEGGLIHGIQIAYATRRKDSGPLRHEHNRLAEELRDLRGINILLLWPCEIEDYHETFEAGGRIKSPLPMNPLRPTREDG